MSNEQEQDNPILKLLDPKDDSIIVLYDEEDKAVEFEQIALIPYNEKLYAILKPVKAMDGVGEDEAIVFAFEEDEDEDQILVVEESDAVIDAVFDVYNKLIEESQEGSEPESA